MAVDLSCLYWRFDPLLVLGGGDPLYVDWQAELGLDVMRRFMNSLRFGHKARSHRLLTVMRGGGKTTELLQLQHRLEMLPADQRHFVSYLYVDRALDLKDAEATDVVLAIVRQLVTDLRRAGVPLTIGSGFKAFLGSARDALRAVPGAGIAVKVRDPAGIVELSTTLQRQPSRRRIVRELLEGELPTLYDAVNEELLPSVLERLRERAPGYS